jgi:hypothetical protein
MNLKPFTSLWLIRLYSLIIAGVVLSDVFEGGTFKLIISMAVILIIVQTFLAQRSDK